jgi:hypothetical protein
MTTLCAIGNGHFAGQLAKIQRGNQSFLVGLIETPIEREDLLNLNLALEEVCYALAEDDHSTWVEVKPSPPAAEPPAAEPYKLRVLAERTDLLKKIENLQAFLGNEAAMVKVDIDERDDLVNQLHHMRAYEEVLTRRIRRWGLE